MILQLIRGLLYKIFVDQFNVMPTQTRLSLLLPFINLLNTPLIFQFILFSCKFRTMARVPKLKSQKILGNLRKSYKILENPRKFQEILGNPKKSQKLLEKPRKSQKSQKFQKILEIFIFVFSLATVSNLELPTHNLLVSFTVPKIKCVGCAQANILFKNHLKNVTNIGNRLYELWFEN